MVGIYYFLIFLFILLFLLILLSILKFKTRKLVDYKFIELISDSNSLFDINKAKELLDSLSKLLNIRKHYFKKEIVLFIEFNSHGAKLIIGTKEPYINHIINYIKSLDIDLNYQIINYLPNSIFNSYKSQIKSFKVKLKNHFVYPFYYNNKSDPLINFVNSFQTLKVNETVQLRISLSAYKNIKVNFLKSRLLSGKKLNKYKYSNQYVVIKIFLLAIKSIVALISLILKIIESFTYNKSNNNQNFYRSKLISNKSITNSLDKLYENLFKVGFSINIQTDYLYRLNEITKDCEVAIKEFNNPNAQTLILRNRYSLKYLKYIKSQIIFPFEKNEVFSSSEISSLFHIPKIKNVQQVFMLNHFKKLLPSSSYKVELEKNPHDIILGESNNYQQNIKIGLSKDDRNKHLLILGTTGSGKSTLIYNMAIQDIKKGRGVCVIDPHGDLADRLISNLPKNREKDLVYINPTKNDLFKINLLEIKSKPGSKHYNLEIELTTETIISLFKKIFSDQDIIGSRIEYLLRNSVKTLLAINSKNIFNIFDLINDPKFRNKVISNLTDKFLKNFWINEYQKSGDFQRVKLSAGLSSKIGRLLFSETLKNIFDTDRSSVDFTKAMNKNKIIICNLSKGKLGEGNSNILGTFILAKLQLSALMRSSQQYQNRTNYYLYVDEFQNYVNSSFTQLLAEVRKYRLFLTLAEQSLTLQDYQTTTQLLANIGNIIAFKLPSPEDQSIIIKYFDKYITNADLVGLPELNFYLKTTFNVVNIPLSAKLFTDF